MTEVITSERNYTKVKGIINNAKKKLCISSGWFTSNGVEDLYTDIERKISEGVKVYIMVRFKSVSDFIIDNLEKIPKGCQVKYVYSLHSKIYASESEALITSGNFTQSGLKGFNFETGVYCDDKAFVKDALSSFMKQYSKAIEHKNTEGIIINDNVMLSSKYIKEGVILQTHNNSNSILIKKSSVFAPDMLSVFDIKKLNNSNDEITLNGLGALLSHNNGNKKFYINKFEKLTNEEIIIGDLTTKLKNVSSCIENFCHAGIFGGSGTGKTYYVKNILLNSIKSKAGNKDKIMIVDTHSEYEDTLFTEVNTVKDALFSKKRYTVLANPLATSVMELKDYQYIDMEETEKNRKKMLESPENIGKNYNPVVYKNTLNDYMEKRRESREKIYKNNFLNMLSYHMNDLKKYRDFHIYIIIDEFSNYISSSEHDNPIIKAIQELRKFNVHFIIISQRPKNSNLSILNNLDAFVTFSLKNKDDSDALNIKYLHEIIARLQTGEFVMNDKSCKYPLPIFKE